MSYIKKLSKELDERKEELLKENPTLYCSARAFCRGKLHMVKVNGGICCDLRVYCWSLGVLDERRNMFSWTEENQEKYVRKFFKRLEKEEVVSAEVPQKTGVWGLVSKLLHV